MSGGSFNYLYRKSIEDLFSQQETMQDMADTLREYGGNDAAEETEKFILEIQDFFNKAATRQESLAGVWKAVEWVKSYDWGEDSIRQELTKYRTQKESA